MVSLRRLGSRSFYSPVRCPAACTTCSESGRGSFPPCGECCASLRAPGSALSGNQHPLRPQRLGVPLRVHHNPLLTVYGLLGFGLYPAAEGACCAAPSVRAVERCAECGRRIAAGRLHGGQSRGPVTRARSQAGFLSLGGAMTFWADMSRAPSALIDPGGLDRLCRTPALARSGSGPDQGRSFSPRPTASPRNLKRP